VLTGRFDAVLDFTGNDRSAAATALSRASVRATFDWVRKKKLRQLAYRQLVDSSVRERHTVDHYLDLLGALELPAAATPQSPMLVVPSADPAEEHQAARRTAVFHPFTARPEKNWLPERWAAVIHHCLARDIDCILTGGTSPEEQQHHAAISARMAALPHPAGGAKLVNLAGQTDLLGLAATIARADLVISCDTAAVHLAAAFQRPQIALFGPTNPFHWRPRHAHAVVVSAAHPDAPLTDFQPRMRGAPMEHLSTELVIRVTDSLLAKEPQP
jgi:ADP-heptose:LPS heptosyltransferase